MLSAENWLKQRQTVFHIDPLPIFNPQDHFFFIGSCFSDEIATRFQNHYIQTCANPFGTLFTPRAIRNALEVILGLRNIDLLQYNQQWHCLDAAARFQDPSKETLTKRIDLIIADSRQQLLNSQFVCVTLGSAYYYELNQTQSAVANCHRIPQKEFTKKRFDLKEVIEDLQAIQQLIKQHIPKSKLIFTVSPVRYLRDGVRQNVLSKSILLLAVETLTRESNSALYFPSFEIAQEELRDHRYFKTDLAHMNEDAIDYIQIRLLETHATPAFLKFWQQAEILQRTQKHLSTEIREEAQTAKVSWQLQRQELLDTIS